MKKVIYIALCAVLLLNVFCGCEKATLKIYGSDGSVIEEISGKKDMDKLNRKAYTEIVLDEAKQIISSKKGCSEDEAFNILCTEKYQIYTYFDNEAYTATETAYNELVDEVDFGCAITDMNSNIISAYSGSKKENTEGESNNYATTPTPPYSAFKPLSVYSQAIEKNIINWSTCFEDSPYKQIENADGSETDWPQNADGKYSNSLVTVDYAIKKSLNTVAVKCISKIGIKNSMNFLEKSFGINLSQEQSKASILGEEEVMGNIAMGYLSEGVSAVDMAGYYEIFGNSGKYTTPKTISKICDSSGTVIYTREYIYKQVISAETASIMNLLLQEVVSADGTGKEANLTEIPVSGKTGSGDNGVGGWFVGITPDYSCAVWHSNYGGDDSAAKSFSNIISKLKTDKKEFDLSNKTVKKIYCCESGMLLGTNCKKAELGYYVDGNLPSICNIH